MLNSAIPLLPGVSGIREIITIISWEVIEYMKLGSSQRERRRKDGTRNSLSQIRAVMVKRTVS